MTANAFAASERASIADTLPKAAPEPLPGMPDETGFSIMEVPAWDILSSDEQAVIRDLRVTRPPQVAPERPKMGILRNLPMQFMGEIAGKVSGNVFCYGYAEDMLPDNVRRLLYLNIAGPARSVTAIRASLGLGEYVHVVNEDGRGVPLSAGGGDGEKGSETGMYRAFETGLPEARIRSMILMHDALLNPKNENPAFIHVTEDASKYRLLERVASITGCPLYDRWANFIWRIGLMSLLIKPSQGGPVTIYTVSTDAEAWTRLIQLGMAEKIITFPKEQ